MAARLAFKIGDHVVHAAYGVGRVVQLSEREFGGESTLYYEVAAEKSTFWVRAAPAPNHHPELRPLCTPAVLARCRRLLKGKPTRLHADHRQRQLALSETLKGGAFEDLCAMVRDLTAQGWRRPLNDADATLLRRARERLCAEWSAAEGATVSDTVREMDALLRSAREVYAA
jgi:RNA polymerase-interacting CarD/CdnL/TRCF family regulator